MNTERSEKKGIQQWWWGESDRKVQMHMCSCADVVYI